MKFPNKPSQWASSPILSITPMLFQLSHVKCGKSPLEMFSDSNTVLTILKVAVLNVNLPWKSLFCTWNFVSTATSGHVFKPFSPRHFLKAPGEVDEGFKSRGCQVWWATQVCIISFFNSLSPRYLWQSPVVQSVFLLSGATAVIRHRREFL